MKRLNAGIYKDLKASLEQDGMIFGLNPEQADQRLEERIGKKRFEAFCRTMNRVREGDYPIHEAYRLFPDAAEANVLMSAQSEVALAVNTAVIEAARLLSEHHAVVGEVGCFSGSVLRHLGRILPGTQFIGFDRVQRLLRSAQAISPPNARFVFWDYSAKAPSLHSQCGLLYGAFPIDFSSPDLSYATDQDEAYRIIGEHYGRQFGKAASRWRQIVMLDGFLVCCLRLPSAHVFAGVVQGAVQAGWEPVLDRCFRIVVAEESFPVLVFRAAEPRDATEEEVRMFSIAFDALEAWQA